MTEQPSLLPETLKPPLLTGTDPELKRVEIKAYFRNSWAQYESLFSNINKDEAFFIKAEPLRHPLVFYFGHTATFYINKLILGQYIDTRIDPHLESICAVGVDEMSWDDLDSENYDWPSVQRVREYRNKVAELVESLIDEMPLELPIQQDSLAWVIMMGIEHERIHLETSSVIIRMLSLEHITQQAGWDACHDVGAAPENKLIAVAGKQRVMGKPDSNPTYGWDNEYGEKVIDVDDFLASQYLVSNAEFLAFVEAGGYQTPRWWTEEGQAWLNSKQPRMPRFWVERNGEYMQRNLTQEIPLPPNWPVEVNYLEAKAFCNFKAEQEEAFIRLPTEAEWQVLRDLQSEDLPYWDKAPGNTNLEHFASSCPVDKFACGEFFDLLGNVWQWTETPIDGFPGFTVHPLYDDFSTPTFDGKHNLIKGGSWISTGNEASLDSRYAFRRHFFQHAGFRYIRSEHAKVPVDPVASYEMDTNVANGLMRQYGPDMGNLYGDKVTQLMDFLPQNMATQRALDLGCAGGRASFELARFFDQVDGIDFTARNIQHALALKEGQPLRFAPADEGELVHFCEVTLQDLHFEELANKVSFYQGDAHNLKPQFTGYDLIYCDLLLEHLYEPARFLKQISSRLADNGVLVINSAYQWNECITAKDKWLGGFKVNGENFSSSVALRNILTESLTFNDGHSLREIMPVNSRCVQQYKSELTIWRKEI